MFNKKHFQSKYIERGMTSADIAKIMGINPATLSRKVNGESDFTRNEIQLFRSALSLTASEIEYIFFN